MFFHSNIIKVFYTVLCLYFPLIQNAQTADFVWAKQFTGNANGYGNCVVSDNKGNIYVSGTFGGTVDFDPGPSTYTLTSFSNADIFVLKLDTAGNFIWAKQMGGIGNQFCSSVTVDRKGNVYPAGYFYGTCDFDPGAGTYTFTESGGYPDAFVSKLDPMGNFVWAKQIISLTIAQAYAWAITVDTLSNLYVTGLFTQTADFDPGPGTYTLASNPLNSGSAFILKLDSSGNFNWAKHVSGNPSTRGNSIVLDDSCNIYTTGYFMGTSDFDTGPAVYNLTSFGNTDIFVSKLDSSGKFIFTKQMGGPGWDYGNSIAIDKSKNIITIGTFDGTSDFDPGLATYNYTVTGGTHMFVSKLNPIGNFIWAKDIAGVGPSGANGLSVVADDAGDLYCTGDFNNTIDFDPGPGTFTITSFGLSDVFVLKLNSSGNFVFSKQMGGTNSEGGKSICLDNSNNIYTAGDFYGTVDFDPGTPVYNLTALNDVFIHKMKQTDPVYIYENTLESGINIYPNPSNGVLNINLETVKENLSVEFYNVSGQLILKEKINPSQSKIELNKLPAGVYTLKVLENNTPLKTIKLVKQ